MFRWFLNIQMVSRSSFRLLAALLLLAVCSPIIVAAQPRIVGGTRAVSSFAYYSQLIFIDPDGQVIDVCSAVLIHADVVLTSALCLVSILLEEAVDVVVFVNTTSNSATSEGEYSTIGISYALHPQFDVVTLENNLAMIELADYIPVFPASTAQFNLGNNIPRNNQLLTIMGLGISNVEQASVPAKLQVATVSAYPSTRCRTLLSAADPEIVFNNQKLFCAAAPGKGSCFGDSGGPIVVTGAGAKGRDLLVGIGSIDGCGQEDSASLYSKVSGFQTWISNTLCIMANPPPEYCERQGGRITSPPAPAPGPGGGNGGPIFCFSASSMVQTNQGIKAMSELQVGESVLVASGKYEPVYSFAHHDSELTAEYLQFLPSKLQLSRDHMVLVENRGFVPASLVKVGDSLVTLGNKPQFVTAITTIQDKGAYAPFTPSGTVVVNNVVASTYVSFQDSGTLLLGGFFDTGLSYQWLAHQLLLPHRVLCRSCTYCLSLEEPRKVAEWFLHQHALVMSMLMVPLMSLAMLFWMLETSLFVGLVVMVWYHVRRNKKIKTE